MERDEVETVEEKFGELDRKGMQHKTDGSCTPVHLRVVQGIVEHGGVAAAAVGDDNAPVLDLRCLESLAKRPVLGDIGHSIAGSTVLRGRGMREKEKG